jgi:hypothetical protein
MDVLNVSNKSPTKRNSTQQPVVPWRECMISSHVEREESSGETGGETRWPCHGAVAATIELGLLEELYIAIRHRREIWGGGGQDLAVGGSGVDRASSGRRMGGVKEE